MGSGKSSLVSALLGEMTKVDGRVSIDGSVAYVAQTAWIINASLKDNVLMGRPFDEARYLEVLEVCEMKQVSVFASRGHCGMTFCIPREGAPGYVRVVRIFLDKGAVFPVASQTSTLSMFIFGFWDENEISLDGQYPR